MLALPNNSLWRTSGISSRVASRTIMPFSRSTGHQFVPKNTRALTVYAAGQQPVGHAGIVAQIRKVHEADPSAAALLLAFEGIYVFRAHPQDPRLTSHLTTLETFGSDEAKKSKYSLDNLTPRGLFLVLDRLRRLQLLAVFIKEGYVPTEEQAARTRLRRAFNKLVDDLEVIVIELLKKGTLMKADGPDAITEDKVITVLQSLGRGDKLAPTTQVPLFSVQDLFPEPKKPACQSIQETPQPIQEEVRKTFWF